MLQPWFCPSTTMLGTMLGTKHQTYTPEWRAASCHPIAYYCNTHEGSLRCRDHRRRWRKPPQTAVQIGRGRRCHDIHRRRPVIHWRRGRGGCLDRQTCGLSGNVSEWVQERFQICSHPLPLDIKSPALPLSENSV